MKKTKKRYVVKVGGETESRVYVTVCAVRTPSPEMTEALKDVAIAAREYAKRLKEEKT